jgi:trigger factor
MDCHVISLHYIPRNDDYNEFYSSIFIIMNTKLTPGKQSNYIVTITFEQSDLDGFHTKALATIQKDFEYKGFRKGHVPLDIVKQQTKPEYVSMVSFEEGINQALQQVVKEHEDKQWIGQPYDLEPSEDGLTITLKLDVYPAVETKNQNYTKVVMNKIDSDLTDAELDDAMLNLRKQFATYDNSDTVELTTTNRMRMVFVDKAGEELDKGSLFVNEEDFKEHKMFQDLFIGKKVGETIDLAYDHDKLPHVVHYHKDDKKPAKIVFEVLNVQKINLPELDEDTIAKLFGTTEVKTAEDVRAKVAEIMAESKVENELTKVTDEYVTAAQGSFEVAIPNTMINEEVKHRMESLKKQFGGEENYKKFIEAK